MEGLSDEDEREFIAELLAWACKEFGLSEGDASPFAKDDWTLIVKLHAMIETGLNGAIIRELNRTDLQDVVAKLDTSNASGKVAFAKALSILDKDSGAVIQQLSTLRNHCVHNIRNFNFNLGEYLASLNHEDRSAIIKPIIRGMGESIRVGTGFLTSKQLMTLNPRAGVIIAISRIFSQLMVHDKHCEVRQLRQRLDEVQTEHFRKQQESTSKE